MDFGSILEQWEKQQNSSSKKKPIQNGSGKKANAPTATEKEKTATEPKINPMELWLRRYGTVDKDELMETSEKRVQYKSKASLIALKIDATLDLHGLTQEEAWNRLESFVTECEIKKLKKIMIIHGKGIHTSGSDPVLGELVRKFIQQDKRLGTSGNPDYNQGGKGATWVILKGNL